MFSECTNNQMRMAATNSFHCHLTLHVEAPYQALKLMCAHFTFMRNCACATPQLISKLQTQEGDKHTYIMHAVRTQTLLEWEKAGKGGRKGGSTWQLQLHKFSVRLHLQFSLALCCWQLS